MGWNCHDSTVTDRNSTTEEGPCEMGAVRGAEGRILEKSREEELGQAGEGDWVTGGNG